MATTCAPLAILALYVADGAEDAESSTARGQTDITRVGLWRFLSVAHA
jgi:hypothetical protein